jgi:hypothetical protein
MTPQDKAMLKILLDADAAQNKPRHTSKGVVMGGGKVKDNKAKAEFGQAMGAILQGRR